MPLAELLRELFGTDGPPFRALKANTVLFRGILVPKGSELRTSSNEWAWFFPNRQSAIGYARAFHAPTDRSFLLTVQTLGALSLKQILLSQLTSHAHDRNITSYPLQAWQKETLLPALVAAWPASGTYDDSTKELSWRRIPTGSSKRRPSDPNDMPTSRALTCRCARLRYAAIDRFDELSVIDRRGRGADGSNRRLEVTFSGPTRTSIVCLLCAGRSRSRMIASHLGGAAV